METGFLKGLAVLPAGFLFGFIISIPMTGPLGVYITGKGMAGHLRQGLLSAIGCAFVEMVYCFIATMGMASLIPYEEYKNPILLIGSVVVIFLGVSGLRKKMAPQESRLHSSVFSSLGDLSVGLFVTVLNPWVMLNWIAVAAVIATWGILFDVIGALLFSLGVGLGTVIWFYIYLLILGKARSHIKVTFLEISLKLLSVALIGIGLFLMGKSLIALF